jgi:glycosyltransferase involved in cell wall biosynthesis
MRTVAAFTDTYLPTVNGVSYTVRTWRRRWRRQGGRMAVVYPEDGDYRPKTGEHPVSSVPFPFYREFRFARPSIPTGIRDPRPDVVHTHTPFTLGLAGKRFAATIGAPLVASYHTPASEYADYISDAFAEAIERIADVYERWYFGTADAVVVPSKTAAKAVEAGETPVYIVPNGVDIDRFAPADASAVAAFRDRYGLPEAPLVGYTGRHGHEKRLEDVLAATAGLDVGVVIAGDGPARPELERRATAREDVCFLGFLDRDTLPAFYTALDAFLFPSPVETQGLVALEAIACGTPVVAAGGGALSETVIEGETGTHFPPGDIGAFRTAIDRTLAETDRLPTRLSARRRRLGVDRSIDALESVYESVLDA